MVHGAQWTAVSCVTPGLWVLIINALVCWQFSLFRAALCRGKALLAIAAHTLVNLATLVDMADG